MNKALLYGAKSREEANLIEQVIDEFTRQNFQQAYDLALQCPTLTWFTQLYDKLNGENDLYEIFKESADAGLLYAHGFAMTFFHPTDIPKEMTEIAAEAGCPISQCIMHKKTRNTRWIQMAADQGYSKALYKLGRFKEAAELGHIPSMIRYATQCKGQEYWYWLAKAHTNALDHMRLYEDLMDEEAFQQVGAILPQYEMARIIYLEHCKTVRCRIDTWSFCAKQMGICRDIRILIAKIIWNRRVFRLH